MKLNLRQIEVFRAIMISGSISGASKLLYVSQPAVSRLIAYTEQRLGLQLFERIKGRLHPTPEAHRLFEEVNALYQSVQRVNEVAENLAQNRGGQLRVSCSPNISQHVMPQAVAIFTKSHPEVRVVLHTHIPHVMTQALITQQIELGVTYMPTTHPSLSMQPLYENRIVAVLPLDHPLATREEISSRDLVHEPFIGYSSDIPFGHLVQQIFGSEENQPVPRVEVQQAQVACALVQAGAGVALVDELTIRGPSWSHIVAIPVAPMVHAPIHAFRLQHQPMSRLAQEFVKVLKSLQ
ncbi:MAG: LysR family transcriptional regulator [Comamonas sp.]